MEPSRILIVEDEEPVARELWLRLEHLGYKVCGHATTAEQALRLIDSELPDVVLMDIVMPGELDGIDAAQQIHRRFGTPVIYLTAYADSDFIERARITEPFGYLVKPFSDESLHAAMQVGIYRSQMELERRRHATVLGTFTSICHGMTAIDPQGQVLYCNAAFASLLGSPPEEIIGQPLATLVVLTEDEESTDNRLPLLLDRANAGNLKSSSNEGLLRIVASGDTFAVQYTTAPVWDSREMIGLALLLQDISARMAQAAHIDQLSAELQTRETRMVAQQQALLALITQLRTQQDDPVHALQSVVAIAARTLGAEQVSLWRYRPESRDIYCLTAYAADEANNPAGTTLALDTHPDYQACLLRQRNIVVNDFSSEVELKDFGERYANGVGLHALLDAPISIGGELKGVLCHEMFSAPRQWSIDEQHFASSVADMVALTMEIWSHVEVERSLQLLQGTLEQRVRDRTTELENLNRELESFSYSVSHDLRAPLRAIDGFSQVLEEDHADQLDAVARDYLGRLRQASQHMNQLIDDLLTLSRTGKRQPQITDVDISRIAQDTADELALANPQHRMQVDIQAGMTAAADAGLLGVLFRNLLENAWKFSRDTPDPRLEVGCRQVGDQTVFYVQDNGAGFDMNYAGRLFGPFQRLHSIDEFPGTGIGLATVNRIIHLLGGEVRAEGRVNAGARIEFTMGGGFPDKMPDWGTTAE